MPEQDFPRRGEPSRRGRKPVPVVEPDVWWGKDGIDAGLGLRPPLYAFRPTTRKEE